MHRPRHLDPPAGAVRENHLHKINRVGFTAHHAASRPVHAATLLPLLMHDGDFLHVLRSRIGQQAVAPHEQKIEERPRTQQVAQAIDRAVGRPRQPAPPRGQEGRREGRGRKRKRDGHPSRHQRAFVADIAVDGGEEQQRPHRDAQRIEQSVFHDSSDVCRKITQKFRQGQENGAGTQTLHLFHHIAHHAPDREFVFGRDLHDPVAGIRRHEQDAPRLHPHPLECELAIDTGYGQAAVVGRYGLVHDQDVALTDAFVLHRVALDPREKRGLGVADDQPVQIERTLRVILGRRRETRMHRISGERQPHRIAALRTVDAELPAVRIHRCCVSDSRKQKTFRCGIHGTRRSHRTSRNTRARPAMIRNRSPQGFAGGGDRTGPDSHIEYIRYAKRSLFRAMPRRKTDTKKQSLPGTASCFSSDYLTDRPCRSIFLLIKEVICV